VCGTGALLSIRNNSEIALSWTDNSNNEVGFTIERTSDPDSISDIANIPIRPKTTSYNDAGLDADKHIIIEYLHITQQVVRVIQI
jgi:hypothetical protein